MLSPPEHLKGRYRLVEPVGKGGTSVVYRAHDDTLGRDVAVKFLATDRIVTEETSARFLREARTIARLNHPNIMSLHDVDRDGPWHYLVLEYIPGQNLQTRLIEQGGALPVPDAIPIIRGVLAGLAYAHAQGVIHRDIKPANIMLTPDGQVKLTDFGLALTREEVRLTQEGAILGTALYLAPEALTGGASDARTDLYAVGAVLYELVTGQAPFTGDSLLAIASQILNAPVTPPRTIHAWVPKTLDDVIVRLLEKDPVRRYASAADVLAALPEPDQAIAPPPDMRFYAAQEERAAALEAERRRLADRLRSDVIESLNLLLAQVSAYERGLADTPQARMAFSVLTSLARQALQQTHDLEAALHPTTLETLGLEPALEALADQARRAHGLQVALAVERLGERLPPQVELALLRLTQDAVDRAFRHARASQITVRLVRRQSSLIFLFSDNGTLPSGAERLRAARQRVEELGGTVEIGAHPEGGLTLEARFTLVPPASLTPREVEVLQLVAGGLSNKEIAGALGLRPRTVNFHLDNIYSKLGINSRTEAAVYALRQGLVPG